MQNSGDPLWLSQFTTRTRAMMRDLLHIHDRVENEGMEVPPEVEWIREQVDSLRRIEALLKVVHGDTRKIPRLMKSLSSIFSFGRSQIDKADE